MKEERTVLKMKGNISHLPLSKATDIVLLFCEIR